MYRKNFSKYRSFPHSVRYVLSPCYLTILVYNKQQLTRILNHKLK